MVLVKSLQYQVHIIYDCVYGIILNIIVLCYLLVMELSGAGMLLFQLFLYPKFERILGPIMVSRIAAVCF